MLGVLKINLHVAVKGGIFIGSKNGLSVRDVPLRKAKRFYV